MHRGGVNSRTSIRKSGVREHTTAKNTVSSFVAQAIVDTGGKRRALLQSGSGQVSVIVNLRWSVLQLQQDFGGGIESPRMQGDFSLQLVMICIASESAHRRFVRCSVVRIV